MKKDYSRKNKTAGLTLIEVLIAMAIAISLFSLGLFVSLDAYRGYIFRSERTVLVSVLEKARSRAMNNINQKEWGVCRIDNKYIIFSKVETEPLKDCADYAAINGNDAIPSNPSAIISGLTGLYFKQLSGKTSASTITITQDSKISEIQINEEGTINW